MTKLEDDPAARRDASRDLERIRTLMERATEYSHLSGVSIVVSGLLAVAGVAVCWAMGFAFTFPGNQRALAAVWGTVFGVAAVQGAALSVANARRKAEPAWSPLTKQVVVAMLPALFAGAALTGYGLQTGQLDLLPPCWMLAYGSSLMGLGLFAGWRIRLAAVAFLLLGAASLFLWREHGLTTMVASFGGLHLVLGAWVIWKPRA
ncbi:MAG TPA: hypothetical protein VKW04_21970 [Planctomycetota bacterium]|nr:hypothetical protein [Planctomycetota bacterium]